MADFLGFASNFWLLQKEHNSRYTIPLSSIQIFALGQLRLAKTSHICICHMKFKYGNRDAIISFRTWGFLCRGFLRSLRGRLCCLAFFLFFWSNIRIRFLWRVFLPGCNWGFVFLFLWIGVRATSGGLFLRRFFACRSSGGVFVFALFAVQIRFWILRSFGLFLRGKEDGTKYYFFL